MTSPITKLAVAAGMIIAVLIGIGVLNTPGAGVAWADVVERFASVPFFTATIYLGHGTAGEAQKIEIWKGKGPIVRAEQGSEVVFADLSRRKDDNLNFLDMDQAITAFDRSTKKPIEPQSAAGMFLGILCPQGQFSLDTIIRSMPGEPPQIVTVETAGTPASDETVLFEMKDPKTTEYIHIWAMRQSKLPVRMRFVDPRNDECVDFLFDYSREKPAAFFDPNAFTSEREN